MLLVHFPICPARAFVLGRELVVFPAVGHAIGRDEFYVHLDLLTRICRAFIRLVLPGTLLLFGRSQLRGRSLEAAIAPDVAALLRLFIAQQQVARILFCVSLYQLDFPVALLQGRVQRRTASILQRLNRAVIPPLPLVNRLAAQPVPLCRLRYPVLRRIFQYPLTIVRFLCYSVHGELLCGGWFVGTAILPHEFSFCLLPCYLCIITQQ